MGKGTIINNVGEVVDDTKMDDFYNFLIDEKKLSSKKAFDIIYYLQEELHVLPDIYERCCSCHILYNTEYEGNTVKRRQYCGDCSWDNFTTEQLEKWGAI